mmetsp:Transcript_39766/g.87306  ORF Transcript_39766/g.87306 Transcript_39766/m.87306 type:complete len:206 (+) Transcript_39766:291-908(+)
MQPHFHSCPGCAEDPRRVDHIELRDALRVVPSKERVHRLYQLDELRLRVGHPEAAHVDHGDGLVEPLPPADAVGRRVQAKRLPRVALVLEKCGFVKRAHELVGINGAKALENERPAVRVKADGARGDERLEERAVGRWRPLQADGVGAALCAPVERAIEKGAGRLGPVASVRVAADEACNQVERHRTQPTAAEPASKTAQHRKLL